MTPQGFVGEAEQTQRRAILSWKKLNPPPHVVVLGVGERLEEVTITLCFISLCYAYCSGTERSSAMFVGAECSVTNCTLVQSGIKRTRLGILSKS